MATTDSRSATRTVDIDSQLTQVALVAEVWQDFVRQHQIPAEAAPFELALVEWINNVIEHAYEMKAGHSLSVRLEWDGQAVHAFVRDCGHPLPPQSLEQPRDLPGEDGDALELLPEGGWGLFLIQQICDVCEYTSGDEGNEVHLALSLQDMT
jgi:serine/threonine-protein kinase RsbW